MADTEVPPDVARIREVYEALRTSMRASWQRDLPLEELLFDRWERARSLGFGEGASIYHNAYVYGDVKVGAHSWIGPFTLLDGSGGLSIGHHCSISAGVQIYTHDTVRWALSGGLAPPERAPVTIGDCCYVGAETVIRAGVTIGHHAVLAACSFVNRDVAAHSIVGGVPMRTLGRTEVDGDTVRLVWDRGSEGPVEA